MFLMMSLWPLGHCGGNCGQYPCLVSVLTHSSAESLVSSLNVTTVLHLSQPQHTNS